MKFTRAHCWSAFLMIGSTYVAPPLHGEDISDVFATQGENVLSCPQPMHTSSTGGDGQCLESTEAQFVPKACYDHAFSIWQTIDDEMFVSNEDPYNHIVKQAGNDAERQSVTFLEYAPFNDDAVHQYIYGDYVPGGAHSYRSVVTIDTESNVLTGETASSNLNRRCQESISTGKGDLAYQLIVYIQARAISLCHSLLGIQ